MIRYTLRCDHGHRFESWFQTAAAYDRQSARKLVACPSCGSTEVEKALMAPRLGSGSRKTSIADDAAAPPVAATAPVPLMSAKERELRNKIRALRDHLVAQADNVGTKFPDEARKMHYGESDQRPIYGEASPTEAKALSDEGIEVFPLPVLPDERAN